MADDWTDDEIAVLRTIEQGREAWTPLESLIRPVERSGIEKGPRYHPSVAHALETIVGLAARGAVTLWAWPGGDVVVTLTPLSAERLRVRIAERVRPERDEAGQLVLEEIPFWAPSEQPERAATMPRQRGFVRLPFPERLAEPMPRERVEALRSPRVSVLDVVLWGVRATPMNAKRR